MRERERGKRIMRVEREGNDEGMRERKVRKRKGESQSEVN